MVRSGYNFEKIEYNLLHNLIKKLLSNKFLSRLWSITISIESPRQQSIQSMYLKFRRILSCTPKSISLAILYSRVPTVHISIATAWHMNKLKLCKTINTAKLNHTDNHMQNTCEI